MKDEAREQLFNYLIKISGGKLTLNPEQLSKVVDVSPKQQSVLRKLNKFPIPHSTVGRLVHYSINSVINYLLDGTETTMQEEPEKKPIVQKTVNKQVRKSNVKNMSHHFTLRSFANRLGDEAKQLQELSDSLNKIANITDSYEKLNLNLHQKNN